MLKSIRINKFMKKKIANVSYDEIIGWIFKNFISKEASDFFYV